MQQVSDERTLYKHLQLRAIGGGGSHTKQREIFVARVGQCALQKHVKELPWYYRLRA